MTQGEMLALSGSERMMRQFRGTPFERDLRQAIKKLSEMLPDGVSVSLWMHIPAWQWRQRVLEAN
jgi:hypothetical protein